MVKIIKAQKIDSKINRELLTKFGEFVYHSEGVESVDFEVGFVNGIGMKFKRDHDEDRIEKHSKLYKEAEDE